jgi:transposase
MPGRSKITIRDEAERVALSMLARSCHRGEADHARAILLTLAGRRAADIAAALGVHVSTVREWRGLFAEGGVAALRRRKPPGRPSRVGNEAAALAEEILVEDTRHDGGWTLPRLKAEIARRGGPAISAGWLSLQLRRKGSAGAGRGTRSKAARTPRRSPPAGHGWQS